MSFTKLKAKDLNQKQICMSSKIIDSEQIKQMKIFYKQNQMVFKLKFLVGRMSHQLKYTVALKY